MSVNIEDNRHLTAEKESILSMIGQELPHGSGFDGYWHLKLTTSTRVNAAGEFHCMNENGMYDGWVYFTVHFDIGDPEVFKITFCSGDNRNRYKAEKYCLREYFEDTIGDSLDRAGVTAKKQIFCKSCGGLKKLISGGREVKPENWMSHGMASDIGCSC